MLRAGETAFPGRMPSAANLTPISQTLIHTHKLMLYGLGRLYLYIQIYIIMQLYSYNNIYN